MEKLWQMHLKCLRRLKNLLKLPTTTADPQEKLSIDYQMLFQKLKIEKTTPFSTCGEG